MPSSTNIKEGEFLETNSVNKNSFKSLSYSNQNINYQGEWNIKEDSNSSSGFIMRNSELIENDNSSLIYGGKWISYNFAAASGGNYSYSSDFSEAIIPSSSNKIIYGNSQWLSYSSYRYSNGEKQLIKVKDPSVNYSGSNWIYHSTYDYYYNHNTSSLSSFSFPFTGTNINIGMLKGPGRGATKIGIYSSSDLVQGSLIIEKTVDNYHKYFSNFDIKFQALKYNQYWVKIEPIPTENGSRYDFRGAFINPSIEYEFYGSDISFEALKYVSNGKVDISINGGNTERFDLYSPYANYQIVKEFKNLPIGNNRITVEASGDKNTFSSGYRLNVNRFLSSVKPRIDGKFKGNEAIIRYLKHWSYGRANLYVDNELEAEIDMYDPSGYVWSSTTVSGLSDSEHSFTLLGTGKNASSTNDRIFFDHLNSSSKNASVTYSFNDSVITYYAMKDQDQGSVDVYLDEEFKGTFSLYSDKKIYSQRIFHHVFNESGNHSLKVVSNKDNKSGINVEKFHSYNLNHISKEDIISGLSAQEINLILSHTNSNFIRRSSLQGNKAIQVADIVLNNNLYVWPDKWSPYSYANDIDWSVNPYNDSSWRLYLESLELVSFLLNGYEVSKDEKYLLKAIEIVSDWIDNHPKYNGNAVIPPQPPYSGNYTYAWNDHSVASRALTICYLLEMIKISSIRDYNFINKLLFSLYEHGEWLSTDINYRAFNHGVMQDRALINLAILFPYFDNSENWLEKGKTRVKNVFFKDVTVDGVHKEHSPAYHRLTMDLYTNIESFLNFYGKSLGAGFKERFNLMKEFLAYVIKPNKFSPNVGDTDSGILNNDYGSGEIKYTLSNGLQGTKPNIVSKVYPSAGIAIFRDKWYNFPNVAKSTYLMFTSAFHSLIHKQADDLSFILYSLGEDIMVDGGKYSYNSSPYRAYVLSNQSHNTVTVDNQSYGVNASNGVNNIGKAKIISWETNEEFDRVKGEHTIYQGVNITRELVFIKPSVVIIFDNISSVQNHSYQQLFNFAPGVYNINYNSNGFSAFTPKGTKISLSQLNGSEGVNYYSGQDNPVRGYVSFRPGIVEKSHQVEYLKSGTNAYYKTIINLESSSFDNQLTDFEISEDSNSRIISYKMDGVAKQIIVNK